MRELELLIVIRQKRAHVTTCVVFSFDMHQLRLLHSLNSSRNRGSCHWDVNYRITRWGT